MRIWVATITITVGLGLSPEVFAQDFDVNKLLKEATSKSSASPVTGKSSQISAPTGEPTSVSDPAVGFPEPLGSPRRASGKTGAPSPKRQEALVAFNKGREAAVFAQDFGMALRYFKQALAAETSSSSLYAAAQCRRAMNRPIEAIFTYANAISEDSKMSPEDRLPALFMAAAKKHLEQLMGQFVAVRVVLQKKIVPAQMLVRGFPVVSTDMFGQKNPSILLAGVRSRWIPISSPRFSSEFVFYTRPGRYDITFVLTDGRRLVLEKRLLTKGNDRIDFTKERIPAKLVVENVQPGMRLLLSRGSAALVDQAFLDHKKEFSLDGLQAGEYAVQVSRDGFEDFDEAYLVSNGEEAHVHLDLSPKRATALPKAWKIGLGVGGGVLVAGIIVTIAILVSRGNEDATTGSGTVTFSLVNP